MGCNIGNVAYYTPKDKKFIKFVSINDNAIEIEFSKDGIIEFTGERSYLWRLFNEMTTNESVGKFYHKYIKNNKNLETKRLK